MLQNWYNIGAASVTNGQTTVTGHNTMWKTGPVQPVFPGDKWGTHVAGGGVRILEVVDDETIILAYPWWGDTQVEAAYEIEIVPDRSRVQETTRRTLGIWSGRGFFRADADSSTGPREAFDTTRPGFYWLDLTADPVELWVRQSETPGDWRGPLAYLTGPTGPAPNLTAGTATTGDPGTDADFDFTGVSPNYTLNLTIPRGDQGNQGWAFEPAIVNDGARRVMQVADFIGGEGSKPGGVGLYVGPAGLTADISEAISIRGSTGATGPRGVTWRGDWDDQVEYVIGDLVVDEDGNDDPAIFIALTANTDSKPRDNVTDWAFFPGTFALSVDYGLITETASEARDYGTIA